VSSEPIFAEVNGERVLLDCAGAAFWPAERTLILADIHFEKGSSLARNGALLPPYDTRTTLRRLAALMASYAPARVIALGDSFHDGEAAERLDGDERAMLAHLVSATEWIWIEGNHDPHPPQWLGGSVTAELAIGGRRVAQRARQVAAEDVAEANARAAHAQASDTGADVLCCFCVHFQTPLDL